MLKALAVILTFAVISGGVFWVLSPLIVPHINKVIPISTDLLTDIPSKVSGLIDYVKQNWQIVGTIAGATFAGITTLSTWFYKRKLQAQEIIDTQRVADAQTAAIQADGARQRIEQNYQSLETKYNTLAQEQPQIAELIELNANKDKEIQKLIAQRNQLAALVPNKDTIKKIEGILEKAEHVH